MFGNASLLIIGLACTGGAHWNAAAANTQELHPRRHEEKVALALLQTSASVLERSNDTAFSAKVPWLTHSSGAVLFLQRTLEEGVSAWTDHSVHGSYTNVPEELVGAVFFAGPAGGVPPGTLSLSSPMDGWAYVWGSPPGADFAADQRWQEVGVMQVSGSSSRRGSRTMIIFRTDFAAGTSLKFQIEAESPWVAGLAFKKASVVEVESLSLFAREQRGHSNDIDGFLAGAWKQLFAKLTLNCNTAAFVLALVLLVSMALGFLACWGDVELLINKRNSKH